MILKFYAIVTHEGKLKKGRTGYAIHTQYARACFWAQDEGDSVVPVEINLSVEPLFIRKKKLNG